MFSLHVTDIENNILIFLWKSVLYVYTVFFFFIFLFSYMTCDLLQFFSMVLTVYVFVLVDFFCILFLSCTLL